MYYDLKFNQNHDNRLFGVNALQVIQATSSPFQGSLAALMRYLTVVSIIMASLLLVSAKASAGETVLQRYPDVVAVKVLPKGENTFNFDVTIASPYDTPERYANAFRVISKDGLAYGERILLHDHATEQPFTRDLYGVQIPTGVRTVVIQARDQQYGYGGKSMEVALPGR